MLTFQVNKGNFSECRRGASESYESLRHFLGLLQPNFLSSSFDKSSHSSFLQSMHLLY